MFRFFFLSIVLFSSLSHGATVVPGENVDFFVDVAEVNGVKPVDLEFTFGASTGALLTVISYDSSGILVGVVSAGLPNPFGDRPRGSSSYLIPQTFNFSGMNTLVLTFLSESGVWFIEGVRLVFADGSDVLEGSRTMPLPKSMPLPGAAWLFLSVIGSAVLLRRTPWANN